MAKSQKNYNKGNNCGKAENAVCTSYKSDELIILEMHNFILTMFNDVVRRKIYGHKNGKTHPPCVLRTLLI